MRDLFRSAVVLAGLSQLPCAARGKHAENLAEALADVLDLWRGAGWEGDCGLRLVGFVFRAQLLAGAGDSESLLVEQLLDAEHAFDVALAVHALSRAALDWLQLRKFGLPETQDIRGQVAQGSHFADAEIKFVGDEDFIRFVLRRAFFARCHFPHCHCKSRVVCLL